MAKQRSYEGHRQELNARSDAKRLTRCTSGNWGGADGNGDGDRGGEASSLQSPPSSSALPLLLKQQEPPPPPTAASARCCCVASRTSCGFQQRSECSSGFWVAGPWNSSAGLLTPLQSRVSSQTRSAGRVTSAPRQPRRLAGRRRAGDRDSRGRRGLRLAHLPLVRVRGELARERPRLHQPPHLQRSTMRLGLGRCGKATHRVHGRQLLGSAVTPQQPRGSTAACSSGPVQAPGQMMKGEQGLGVKLLT